jgi:hypothetical protein
MEPDNGTFLQKLERFMGGLPVKKLPELFDTVFDGVAVVPVWFDSVVEGVDMWFKGEQVDNIPRYIISFLCSLCWLVVQFIVALLMSSIHDD